MQLVIEISKYNREWIQNGHKIPDELQLQIAEAIINGIELPEDHGKIGDIDALKKLCSQNEISNSAYGGTPVISKKKNVQGDNIWELLFNETNIPTLLPSTI